MPTARHFPYYQHADGNRMEFQVDCSTVEEANAYMQFDAFAANPAGYKLILKTVRTTASLHATPIRRIVTFKL